MADNERDSKGRFTPGNTLSSKGGTARAKRLTPERRREIAAAGWRGVQADNLRLRVLLADIWDAWVTATERGGLVVALDGELSARLRAAIGKVD